MIAQKSNKDYKQLISSGDKHVHAGEFQEAYQLYLLAWNIKKSGDLAMRATRCLFMMDQEVKALPYLEYVQKTGFKSLELARFSAIAYHKAYRLEEAFYWAGLYEKNATGAESLSEAKKIKRQINNAKRLVPAQRESLKLKNLGPTINSQFDDYSPVLTADEQSLYFTSRRNTSIGRERDETGIFYEDIYFSRKRDSVWSVAENMGELINTEQHDATAGISPSGDELFIYRPDNGGDIFISRLHRMRWTEPVSMGNKINSSGWETSISTTPDEKVVVFSSNRNGGIGGKDIYLARMNADGTWQDPILLGKEVNTEFDEEGPFIHPDGKTLYFSSQGHNSMGGYDIFRCEIDLATGKIVDSVQNLGYPISDVGDDVFFVWSPDNKRAYFSSEREGGYGRKDIYVAELDYHIRPEIKVLKIQVKESGKQTQVISTTTVTDLITKEVQKQENSGTPSFVLKRGHTYRIENSADGFCSTQTVVQADTLAEQLGIELKANYRRVIFKVDGGSSLQKPRIKVRDPLQGDYYELSDSESNDGQMSLLLKEGVSYSIEIIRKGFMVKSDVLEVPASSCDEAVEKRSEPLSVNFRMDSIAQGANAVLKEIYFATGKVKPLPESHAQLMTLVEFLLLNNSVGIMIEAHTDEVGSASFNLQLSQQRAEAIADFLQDKGVAPGRIRAVGKGETQPVYKGDEISKLALNRRVEFRIERTDSQK